MTFGSAGGVTQCGSLVYSWCMKLSCSLSQTNSGFVHMSFENRLMDFFILFFGYLCLMQKFRPSPRRDRALGGMSLIDLHRLCIVMLFGWLK